MQKNNQYYTPININTIFNRNNVIILCLFSKQPVAGAGPQVVHTQQRVTTGTTPAEVVAIATGQGVRAGAPVTASAVVSTTLSPAQSQTRSLVTQVTPGRSARSGLVFVNNIHKLLGGDLLYDETYYITYIMVLF